MTEEFIFNIDKNKDIKLSLFNVAENYYLTIMFFDNENGEMYFIYHDTSDSQYNIHKKLKKFLDQSNSPIFLPRFKFKKIHLNRKNSRELYDFLSENTKSLSAKREECIDDMLKS
jgi:hypothetical protein